MDLFLKAYSFTYMILFQMSLLNCEARQTMSLGSMKTQNLKSIISAELSQEIVLYYSALSVSPETPPARSKTELPEPLPARQCLPWGRQPCSQPCARRANTSLQIEGNTTGGWKGSVLCLLPQMQRFGSSALLDKTDINLSLSVGCLHQL